METDAAITGIITMRSVAITVIMKTDAVMDITMTMRDITMRMRYSQAGALRRLKNMREQRLSGSWTH